MQPHKKTDIADWFYKPVWHTTRLPAGVHIQFPQDSSPWLIFCDTLGLGERIARLLAQQGGAYTLVRAGKEFGRSGDCEFTIRPDRLDDHIALCYELDGAGDLPDKIVHLWSVTQDSDFESSPRLFDDMQHLGFYSLLYLTQALDRQNAIESLELIAVSNGIHAITGAESLRPEKSCLLGACKSVAQEYGTITCRAIDLEISGVEPEQIETLSRQLWAELISPPSGRIVAYRSGRRYVPDYEPLRLEKPLASPLRRKGTYLIVGGWGGIGSVLAEHLAKTEQAKLVLIGRSALPDRDTWQEWLTTHEESDRNSVRIRKAQALEALGAEVLGVQANAADRAQMQRAVEMAQARFGQIHGAIYAAGNSSAEAFNAIQTIEPRHCEMHFRPKVYGLYVLEEILKEQSLEFCVLFSSLSAILAGLGMVAYTAANIFIDAFTDRHNRIAATRWTCVNWDQWQLSEGEERRGPLGGSIKDFAMTPAEGVDAFERILAGGSGARIVLSTGNLAARIRQWIDPELPEADEQTAQPEASFIRKALMAVTEPAARRTLLTVYLQEQAAHVLRLSPSQIAPQHSLGALGLDSLMAVELEHTVEAGLDVTLPIADFLQGLSIYELATRVLDRLDGTPSTSAIPAQTPPLRPISRDELLPLSFSQQRLWLLDQLEPGNPLYNIPIAVRLIGSLNVTVLERSLNEIARRHETLRTRFTVRDGQPIQTIAPELRLNLPIVDLSEWPNPLREGEVRRLTAQEARRSFDLTQAPLVRVLLLQLAEKKHVFVVVAHHAICDGWSMGILGQEISIRYAALLNGTKPSLPELPVQYADFAHWQRQWFREDILAASIRYWKEKLKGAPPLIEFPADRPRPPIQTFRGARQRRCLSPALTQALQDLNRRESVTLFMTLLAAFKVLLHRYTGQNDIVVGTPIAGRGRPEAEGLIGMFLNTLVLRTDLSGNPTFRELLARVRQTSLEAYAHQDLPFEKLLEALRPKRDLSYTPLFQVFINLLHFPNDKLELRGATSEILPTPDAGSNFDLTLYITPQDETIQLELVYNIDLFERERMAETLAQLECVLEQIAANPDIRIVHLSLVTPTAQACLPDPVQALPAGWNGSIPERFSQQARQAPERSAVVDAYGTWRYEELDARSNQLANLLRVNGIQRQDVVAIYAQRSAALVWAVLGILKAGASSLILDPAYPPARLIDYVRIAQPRGWVQLEAAGESPEDLKAFASMLPCRVELPRRAADASGNPLNDYPTDDPGVALDADDRAYVVFTSGSTGKPKAVEGTHRPLSHFLHWHCGTFGLDRTDRFSLLSGLAHDPLLRDLFTPLWIGATLCIPDLEDMVSPDRLADWMKRESISVAHMTPAMGQLLTGNLQETTAIDEGAVLSSLRYVFFGGDLLSWRDASRLRKLAPSATCVNFYGTTETPQAMGYFVIPQQGDPARAYALSDDRAKASVPLGRGIEGVQLLVLNASQQLVGVGELGEIHVRTPYLTKGYLGDAALTQARFITNSFASPVPPPSPTGGDTGGGRLYKTGDLGRYLPDGNVEFFGRADHQVKIRGFRIELEEIEAVLAQHPAVQEAVVIAHEDRRASGDRQLVAYVLPALDQSIAVSALRRFARERLPEYMLPSSVMVMDRLPLTPNGKVDRRALPPPEGIAPESQAAYAAPRTQMEQTLVALWQEALHVETVGIHDNFFDLGGHSLLMAGVHAKLQAALDREFSMIQMFKHPTVSALADYLSRGQAERVSPQPNHERASTRMEALRQQRQFRQQYRAAKERTE